MKKFIKKGASLVGLVAAGAIGAAALAPTASADASQFLADATDAGFYNNLGPSAELHVGYWACNSISYGYRPIAVARDLWLSSPMDAYASGKFVGIAVRDLCPQYFDLAVVDVLTELNIEGYTGPGPGALV
jgi:uncharacterized protein DUF732